MSFKRISLIKKTNFIFCIMVVFFCETYSQDPTTITLQQGVDGYSGCESRTLLPTTNSANSMKTAYYWYGMNRLACPEVGGKYNFDADTCEQLALVEFRC